MRIVVGVDVSTSAEDACRFVASRRWPTGTAVELVAAFEAPFDWTGLASPGSDAVESDRATLEAILQERAALLRNGGLAVTTTLEEGDPAATITRRAEQMYAQLIVVGSRRLGPIAAAVLGSVSAHLVDHAPCPVLVARSPGATRMLLATDGTDSSRNIPYVLASWGEALRHLPVEVLSVAPQTRAFEPLHWLTPPGDAPVEVTLSQEYLQHERIADQVADEMMDLGWHAAAVASVGDTRGEIIAAAGRWRANLIVTGSRGLGAIRRHLQGSVSHDLLMHSQSSLLVVRGVVPAAIGQAAAVAIAAPA
jgi:nucleotide-binding universal stress UspA family protein